ncbi:MAG: hypothetical protein QOH30_2855 [Baekduia sp.]|jgi:hypothetical protein|nr:hypothetical protein [Conexibacter sp.]MDX6716297.1 hypothetical protein [Baekduia sp.]
MNDRTAGHHEYRRRHEVRSPVADNLDMGRVLAEVVR